MILHYGMEEEEESLSKGKKGIEVVFLPLSFFLFSSVIVGLRSPLLGS